MASSVNYLSQIVTSTKYPNFTRRTMKNEAIPKWNEIVLPRLGVSIPYLSALSQRNGLRCGSPVQLAFLEAHRYFRSNSLIENTPWWLLKPYKYFEESTLQKDRLLQVKDVWKAICSAQTCAVYNRAPRCRSLYEIAVSPQGDLLSLCQGTHALVTPPAVPQKIAMPWYRRYP